MSLATKRGRLMTYFEELHPHKIIWRFDLARSNNKLKALYLHFQSAYYHQAWEDDNLPLKSFYQLSHRMLRLSGLARSCNKLTPFHLQYQSLYDSQTWQDDDLSWENPTLKLLNPLVKVSCKITWQNKIIISPLWQCLWQRKLASWWLNLLGSYLFSDMTL